MTRQNILDSQNPVSDSIYNSRLILAMIKALMKKGKKHQASTMMYQTLDELQVKTKRDPIQIIERAIKNVIPESVIKARRVGGSTYQIPIKVTPLLGRSLAIRWVLTAARKRTGKTMVNKLANELLDASKSTGGAVRKREETQRMADANKVFARDRV